MFAAFCTYESFGILIVLSSRHTPRALRPISHRQRRVRHSHLPLLHPPHSPGESPSFGSTFQMTLTRRKSKAAAAAAAAQQDTFSTQDTPPASTSGVFIVSLPSDIDLDALSTLIPGEPLEAPTEDTVIHLYRTLLAHVTQVDVATREVEELHAEAEKKEVELDQVYQDRENDKKEMEALADNLQKELRSIKGERDELGMYFCGQAGCRHSVNALRTAAAKAVLQTQLSSASSSHSASSAELGNLKTRIEDVEREKRDLVGIVGRLKEDCTQRDGMMRFIVGVVCAYFLR